MCYYECANQQHIGLTRGSALIVRLVSCSVNLTTSAIIIRRNEFVNTKS
nr:MAG TPA: hypothetical protein [Caudoviricetes sp.]